jgi:hypothetical protein
VLTDEEVFGYQSTVWSSPEFAGFDELVDMSGVERIALPSVSRVRDLAFFSAAMDAPDRETKLAIVAPSDMAFGLGRMLEAYRGSVPQSKKKVGVFRTMAEALKFLGLEVDPRGHSEIPAGDSQ